MRLVQQAAILNDEATALVCSGRLLDAMHSLQYAIYLLRMSTQTSECDRVQQPHSSLGMFDQTPPRLDEYGGYNYEGMMFIYDELFSFSDVVADDSPEEDDDYMFRTACVFTIFNLALVFQLHARVTGIEASAVRALLLYQSILPSKVGWAIDALLQCLVLNNLAEIHQQLCEYDCTALCMELVAQIANKTRCFDLMLSEREVKAITLNYALAQFSTAAPTA